MTRARGDHGYNVGLTASAVGLATGALVARAHEDGMAAVRAHFDGIEEAREAARQARRDRNFAALETLAHGMADEIAALREKNSRLERLLAQRQAVIDTLRRP